MSKCAHLRLAHALRMPLLRCLPHLFCLLLLVHSSRAGAEPVLVSLEGAGALPLTSPQSEHFGPGGFAALGVAYPLAPALALGLRLRAGLMSDGETPAAPGVVDPELGTLATAALTLRLRPFASGASPERATGLFLDVAGGGGFTGSLQRATVEAGLGYGIPWGSAAIAPVLRYVQVIQPEHPLSGEDARLLSLGIELTFFDARRAISVTEPSISEPEAPSDRDGDGIPDERDACPDQAEDFDGFEDDDGCPDVDNDRDGIPDRRDHCPDQAEDFDGWEDEDGCPDPDNDGDGFLDADDQCPNEPEVVNGNKDYDGCPDEGLFELKNDRIVLEERVLFDFERARVKREARPVLKAIAKLKEQHPEWTELRIEGHADEQGDAKFNQELSERRAANVMRELVKYGISAAQISAVGYGSTRPRDRRGDDEGHARNRRVEFVVVARSAVPIAQPAPPDPANGGESGRDGQAGDDDEDEADDEAEPNAGSGGAR